uniref:PHD and ring finger domains 1 n=1 Tax=Nothobranchius kadleci TaxID=1051664 RepID=A0A1A8DL54_NOTKA
MDEDDSQDELINRSTSHSKGKRAALWTISDDSDDQEEESEEGESDSGDEEEDDVNQDENEEGEDDDDEEEEEDAEPENGAFGGTSADVEGMSSDEDSERCPICLNSFNSQPVATPENCEHYFCFDCILEWAKNANSCPVDRIAFNNIYLRKCHGGRVKKVITVQKPVKAGQEETVNVDLEQTNCEVCGGSDREDRLLLCDGCDAGYHMECLTPPLDSVPVEEWFCPECEANNRHSRGSAEEVSDADSLSSPARPATSRSQPRSAGPTRAIARTQQSERVRASVNRHRITQARTSQLAPTYLIQSTWLDETINAVVAGLNTAVYVRDITSQAPSSRRRATRKRRKVKSKKTASAKGNKEGSTVAKRRRRRARRNKSRKKLILKKTATPRSRIANNLGIVKDKKSSSLPTVYRPSEHTLSSMRADIGAASLSIYGDPFDLDPFVDHERGEQEAHVTSLLEAKRRGISRSALRSHQPVARPVSAGLSSRRSMDVPRSAGVVEAAPVPDLLGSILSGQSMLLMDSSDVVINRDGSLKTAKPMLPNTPMPNARTVLQSSSSGDANIAVSPGFSSFHHNGNIPGSSHTSPNGTLSQNPSHLPSLANHIQPTPLNLPPRGNPSFPPINPNVSALSPRHWENNEVGVPREAASSVQPTQDSNSKSKGVAPSQSQTKKASVKPTWVDVSVLPRIPKIKRESGNVISNGACHGGNYGSNRVGSDGGSTSNGSGLPESSMSSLSGDKGKQRSVDQQKGHTGGQAQKSRPERTSSSSAFSNSFSSSSSSSGTSASQSRHASFSSSSSVSFRINSSGNSWHARHLSMTSSSSSGSNVWEQWKDEEQEVKKKRLHKDKKEPIAFRNTFSEESEDNNIYDPFNPTQSESSNSGGEAESPRLKRSPQSATRERKSSVLENTNGSDMSEADLVQLKTETREAEVSQEEPGCARISVSQERGFSEDCVKVKQESELTDLNTETVFFYNKFKKEPSSEESDGEESESYDVRVKKEREIKTDAKDNAAPARQSFDQLDAEQKVEDEHAEHLGGSFNVQDDSSASTSTAAKKKQTEEAKSDSTSCSKHPFKDSGHKKPSYKTSKEQQSSRFETDAGRREDRHGSDKGGKKKERDRDRNSRRSQSRERRRVRSSSDGSRSSSPDTTRRRRRHSRSRSTDKTRKRRSRSLSSSSSREHSRRKKHQQTSRRRSEHKERDSDKRRVSKDKRRGRSRSRSRSRSRERRKDSSRSQQMSLSSRDKVESPSNIRNKQRSRSRSRERMKDERSSRSSAKMSDTCGSSSRDAARSQEGTKTSKVPGNTGDAKCAEGKKQELAAISFISEVKKEEMDYDSESQIIPTGDPNEIKNEKEAKIEKSVDIFEDSFTPEVTEREEMDTTYVVTSEFIDDVMEDPSKTEYGEMMESEPNPVPLSPLPPTSSPTADIPDPASEPGLGDPSKQNPVCSIEGSVKQEPSDSDDDFNVDMMLDSLDYVNPEQTEGSGAAVKEEKEAVKVEEEQVPTMVGSKSKTQVKRVTWNIQEPEGPQPEKSQSKLALYKRKLKQEGSRKTSLAFQAAHQDVVSDPAQKRAAFLSTSSGSGGLQPGESSTTGQGEAEEGDFSRKDKHYLKKLHMLERAVEEVKLAIKPFYQKRDINKEEYKEILRKAVQKVCHSKSGEINPVKVGNLIKAYVEKYKHARKHKKGDDSAKAPEDQTEAMKMSESP